MIPKPIVRKFTERVSNKYLGMFRIGAYALMAYEVSGLMSNGFFEFILCESRVRFPYELIPIDRVFSIGELNMLYGVVVLSAMFCSIGLLYKYSRWVFLISYSYLFFQDKMFWNNHWYLFVLIGILAILVDLGSNYSLDTVFNPKKRQQTSPRWHYYLFCFLVSTVYFFGGIAKLDTDWLVHAEPMGIFLNDRTDHFLFGPIFSQPWAKYFFAYGGVLFDLGIGFLLFAKRTFKFAVLLTVIFNGLNAMIFHIGIFPYFMLASNLLFAHVLLPEEEKNHSPASQKPSRLRLGVIVAFCVFHLVFPLRQFLYQGNPSWIGICERFSWRMMIQFKQEREMKFFIYHKDDGSMEEVDFDLSHNHRIALIAFPEVIADYAKGMRQYVETIGMENVEIRADIQVNLNNGPYQYLVDKNYDLSRDNRSFYEPPKYIIPRLEEK